MVTFEATIKEKGGAVLHPTYTVPNEDAKYKDKRFFIDFWGLNNDDVEEWEIEKEGELLWQK